MCLPSYYSHDVIFITIAKELQQFNLSSSYIYGLWLNSKTSTSLKDSHGRCVPYVLKQQQNYSTCIQSCIKGHLYCLTYNSHCKSIILGYHKVIILITKQNLWYTILIHIEARGFISYKQLFTRCLYEPCFYSDKYSTYLCLSVLHTCA